jgi:hypothetical protein
MTEMDLRRIAIDRDHFRRIAKKKTECSASRSADAERPPIMERERLDLRQRIFVAARIL